MTKATTLSLDSKTIPMLLLLAAVWGGTFFFAEVALEEVPPLTITLFRVFLALPILATIVLLKVFQSPDPLRFGEPTWLWAH